MTARRCANPVSGLSKVRYSSPAKAHRARIKMQATATQRLRVYGPCEHCGGGWHVTGQPQRGRPSA